MRGDESLKELLTLVTECHEFTEIKLRTAEKKALNELNKSDGGGLRFPVAGKIKNRNNKILCLVQAVFGCLPLTDPGLNQEVSKIIRIGQRLTKCLCEVVCLRAGEGQFEVQLNAALLAKCFSCRLWEHSRHVTRQLPRIGPTLASALAASRVTSFTALEAASPRDIEMVCNRQPPFGNKLQEMAALLPRYELTLRQLGQVWGKQCRLEVLVRLANAAHLGQQTEESVLPRTHASLLILGDQAGNTLCAHRITDASLLQTGEVTRGVTVNRVDEGDELAVNFISETWAGLDVQSSFVPRYSVPRPPAASSRQEQDQMVLMSTPDGTSVSEGSSSKGGAGTRRPCLHHCTNKQTCAHDCCKVGVREVGRSGLKPALVANKRRAEAMLHCLPNKRFSLQTHDPNPDTQGPGPVAGGGDCSQAPPTPARPTPVAGSSTPLKTLSQFGFQCTRPKMQYNNTPHRDTPVTDANNNNVQQSKSYSAAPENGTSSEAVKTTEYSSESFINLTSGDVNLNNVSWEDCIDIEPNAVSNEFLSLKSPSLNNERSCNIQKDNPACSSGADPLMEATHLDDSGLGEEQHTSKVYPAVSKSAIRETSFQESSKAEVVHKKLSHTSTTKYPPHRIKTNSERDKATEPKVVACNDSGIWNNDSYDTADVLMANNTSTRHNNNNNALPKQLTDFSSVVKPTVTDTDARRRSLSLSSYSDTGVGAATKDREKDHSNQRLATLIDRLKNEWAESQKSLTDNDPCSTPKLVSTPKKNPVVASVTPEPRNRDTKANETPAKVDTMTTNVIGRKADQNIGEWVGTDVEKYKMNGRAKLTELYRGDDNGAAQRRTSNSIAAEACRVSRAETACSVASPEVHSFLNRLKTIQGSSSIFRNDGKHGVGGVAEKNAKSSLEKIIKSRDSNRIIEGEEKSVKKIREAINTMTGNNSTVSNTILAGGLDVHATSFNRENVRQVTNSQEHVSLEESLTSGRNVPPSGTERQDRTLPTVLPSYSSGNNKKHRVPAANLVAYYQHPQQVSLPLVNQCVNTQPVNLISLYQQPGASPIMYQQPGASLMTYQQTGASPITYQQPRASPMAVVGQHCVTSPWGVMGVYQQPMYSPLVSGVCGPNAEALPQFASMQQQNHYEHQVEGSMSVWSAEPGNPDQSRQ